jgi:uncharacterized protein involved in copper resistance
MKTPIKQKVIIAGLLALTSVLAVPLIRADEAADKKAERKAAREQKILEKYDTNHDGKLDDTEKAAMKADRAEKRKKKASEKSDADAAVAPSPAPAPDKSAGEKK